MPHQHFQQPTPTTRRLPERRSRTPFYTAVACSSLVLGLLLGVGGFFGVRTLQDDPVRATDGPSATADGTSTDGSSSDGESSEGGDSGEPTATEIATASETLTQTPTGKDEAVDIGTAVRMDQPLQGIPVDMRISTVDWDATDELHDANTFNEAPKAGGQVRPGHPHGRQPRLAHPRRELGLLALRLLRRTRRQRVPLDQPRHAALQRDLPAEVHRRRRHLLRRIRDPGAGGRRPRRPLRAPQLDQRGRGWGLDPRGVMSWGHAAG